MVGTKNFFANNIITYSVNISSRNDKIINSPKTDKCWSFFIRIMIVMPSYVHISKVQGQSTGLVFSNNIFSFLLLLVNNYERVMCKFPFGIDMSY